MAGPAPAWIGRSERPDARLFGGDPRGYLKGIRMSSNIALARPFVQATVNVLSAMAGITAEAGAPFFKKDNTARGDVSAIVGVTGAKNGAVALSFSQSCAIAVVRGMLGDDIEDILADTRDAVGEITNMISGQARASLAEMGLVLQGSTPSIVFGDRHTLSFPGKAAIIAIPFSTEHGDFTLECYLQ